MVVLGSFRSVGKLGGGGVRLVSVLSKSELVMAIRFISFAYFFHEDVSW